MRFLQSRPPFRLAVLILFTFATGSIHSQTPPVPQASPQVQQAPVYQVYAIRYATLPEFPVAALVKGADPNRKLDIAMIVWLVKGKGRTILMDSGFYREQFLKAWTVKDFLKPSEAVAQFGVKPEETTDVIIAHMHWDHAGGMDLFPRARIWIQKDEYNYYTGEAWQQKSTTAALTKMMCSPQSRSISTAVSRW